MQQQAYGTFSTSRRRAAIGAPIATLLMLAFLPHNLDFSRYPVLTVIFDLLFLLFLLVAVRAWIALFRRPAELRLMPDGLTIKYGSRELTVPWSEVGQFRIDRKSKTPWVVVWLNAGVATDDVPVPRQPNGGFRVLPLGRGWSTTRRIQDLGRFRAAVMSYGGHYLDPV